MQFSLSLLALLAATAVALPAQDRRNFITDAASDVVDGAKDVGSDVVNGAKDAAGAVENGAKDAVNATENAVKDIPGELQQAFGANCQLAKCAAALGPAAAGCGIAAAQGFADPLADIPCLATAINSVANVPTACAQCHVPDIPGLSDIF